MSMWVMCCHRMGDFTARNGGITDVKSHWFVSVRTLRILAMLVNCETLSQDCNSMIANQHWKSRLLSQHQSNMGDSLLGHCVLADWNFYFMLLQDDTSRTTRDNGCSKIVGSGVQVPGHPVKNKHVVWVRQPQTCGSAWGADRLSNWFIKSVHVVYQIVS